MSASRIRQGNRVCTIHHADECDGYTREPTHLRLFKEDYGDDEPWSVDGADDSLVHYTERLWRFATFEEAVAAMSWIYRELILGEEVA